MKTDEPYVQSASAWLDRCKMGSWMKQDLETCTASGRILCASEPRAAITQGEEYYAKNLQKHLQSYGIEEVNKIT